MPDPIPDPIPDPVVHPRSLSPRRHMMMNLLDKPKVEFPYCAGVLLPDGRVFFVPYDSTEAVLYHPDIDAAEPTTGYV